MKNILCYGDSNTWGLIAGSMQGKLRLAKRYPYDVRWTGVLQQLLGPNYHIIEGGLHGRNTSFDETHLVRPSRNGLATLPLIMNMDYPLDLVVLLLGTNDCQIVFKATIQRILEGVRKLIACVKSSQYGPNYSSPEVLLLSPPPVVVVEGITEVFFDQESLEKLKQLGPLYKKIAEEEKCAFLEFPKEVGIDLEDGIHIDLEGQKILAKKLCDTIKTLL